MLRNALDHIATYPIWKQTLLYLVLYLAALSVFGLLVLLSPFVMILAGLLLVAAMFTLVVRFLRGRPLRRGAIVALTSLVLLVVFMGISNALYFNAQPQQADSPKPDKQTSKPSAKPGSPEQAAKHEGLERPNQGQRDTDQTNAKAEGRPSTVVSDNAEGSQPTVMVTRVVDGDTIEISPPVDGQGTVTLVGIDAPEGEKPACGPQPLAQQAADHASLWIGRKVRLEFDQEHTDEYGQLLAYVHDAETGEIMNVDMIRSGYAQVYVVPPNTKYEDDLRKAQDEAKSTSGGFGTGIWSLSVAEAAQLADHANGIGNGEGACSPESQIPRSASSSSASSSASPSPSPTPNTLNPSATSSASSSASPAAGGSSSSASPAAGGGY